MITPALAVEPPTPHENTFQFGNIPHSNHGMHQSQARCQSPLKTSFNFHNHRGFFHSPTAEGFSSSPNSYPAAFHTSSFSSQSCYDDHPSGVYSKAIGLPIARSNVKSHLDSTSSPRKAFRHHRDLSGTSSTTSSLSGPPHDFCPAIDPSALQPPLRKLQTETSVFTKNEVNHIISPFINQVLEHGPDGTMTGRYSRPLTSTGRPSHARKTPPGHVKRPRNAFILFRSHACSSNLIPPTVEKDHRQISRIVSHMWKSLPANEKLKWEREAEAEKELHRKLHPDYRYKPIYRKENSAKKNQGGSSASPSAKKKSNCPKKLKGVNSDSTDCTSKDSENGATVNHKTPDQLQQERDEEIRCEAVAKVLMETKLTGITLDEIEMEERVLHQVRLVKENEVNQSRMKCQSQVDGENDQVSRTLAPNSDPTAMSISASNKPKNKILAPLQARRKSLLNRSNSAPPPPSPLRTMHVREVVYNPKARGSRELSPDFPKPKVMTSEDDMKIENIPYQSGDLSHPVLFPESFHSQLPGETNFNPFAATSTKNLSYQHYQCDSTPSQELEHLFHSPDFAFADENCFRSQQNEISHNLFAPQMHDQDDYPIFNGLYGETDSRYRKGLLDQRQWENSFYQNDHYSSELCDPLTKLPEDRKAIQFLEASCPDTEEKQPDSSISCEGKKSTPNGIGNGFLKYLVNSPNARRPSLNAFSASARRKSSVTMALNESCSPQLIEAIELAKKNMAVFSDQKEEWCNGLNEPTKRRHSVVLSGLGEFPIMDLPFDLAGSNTQNTTNDVNMECNDYSENPSGSNSQPFSQTNLSNTGGGSFSNFIHPFATSTEMYRGGVMNPPESPNKNDNMAQNNFADSAAAQNVSMASSQGTKESQILNGNRSSLPGITFESGIGPGGQTYLFLTKEQAETEGLIAQILDAGFGVTYETDIPQEET